MFKDNSMVITNLVYVIVYSNGYSWIKYVI